MASIYPVFKWLAVHYNLLLIPWRLGEVFKVKTPPNSTNIPFAKQSREKEPDNDNGHDNHKPAFFSPVFRSPFEYRTIWQLDTTLPFEYQTSPVFRWLLYRINLEFRWFLYLSSTLCLDVTDELVLKEEWGEVGRDQNFLWPDQSRLFLDYQARAGLNGLPQLRRKVVKRVQVGDEPAANFRKCHF